MKTSAQRVLEFHRAFGHPAPDAITTPPPALRELRVRLIAEELVELCNELGVELRLMVTPGHGSTITAEAGKKHLSIDPAKTAKELADLDYVVTGTAIAFGLPHDAVCELVHASNMSKLGADGKPLYRGDGKVLKGPAYREPDVHELLVLLNDAAHLGHMHIQEVVELEEEQHGIALTVKEISELADFAGVVGGKFSPCISEEVLRVTPCPAEGILDDDGIRRHYKYIASFEDQLTEGCMPLGDEVAPPTKL